MRKFRAWLIWLVVAVIPLQGLAAAVMPLTAGAGLQRHDASVQVHHHAADTVALSDHALMHGADRAALSGGCDGCADDPAAHGPLNCCSASCSMALAVHAGLYFGHQARPPAPQPALAGLHPGVVPDGLDRPPRSS